MSDDREGDETQESVDPTLQMLLDVVEASDLEIGVTALVRGSVVTGLAISERAYVSALGERWRQTIAAHSPSSTAADAADALFQDCSALLAKIDAPVAGHLHLREAYVLAGYASIPKAAPEVQPMLLRVPVSRVDSFSLGGVSVAAPNDD
jgi:hypothetical protein